MTKPLRFKGTSFGYGNKINIAQPLNTNPGAGQYSPLTSSFVK